MSEKKKNTGKTLAVVSGFVFEVILLIGLGFICGTYLDRWLGTDIVFTVLLMIFFMFFGIVMFIVRINKMEERNGKK